jgi:C-terminal processing protease CtpA/Prc
MAAAGNAGVGMVIQPDERGDLYVVTLVDGGPAQSSGQVANEGKSLEGTKSASV